MSVRAKMTIAPLAPNPRLFCDERNCMRAAAFSMRTKLVDSREKLFRVEKMLCAHCMPVHARNATSLFVEEAFLSSRDLASAELT